MTDGGPAQEAKEEASPDQEAAATEDWPANGRKLLVREPSGHEAWHVVRLETINGDAGLTWESECSKRRHTLRIADIVSVKFGQSDEKSTATSGVDSMYPVAVRLCTGPTFTFGTETGKDAEEVAGVLERLRPKEDEQEPRSSGIHANSLTQMRRQHSCSADSHGSPRAKRGGIVDFVKDVFETVEAPSKTKSDNVQDDYEDFEMNQDVYATAYLLARNATPGMYTFNPIRNPEMGLVWFYLVFILGSQILALVGVAFWQPPAVSNSVDYVDCGNATHVQKLMLKSAIAKEEECWEAGDFAFEAELRGRVVSYRRVEHSVYFYQNTFGQSLGTSASTLALQAVCCIWVFTQVLHRDFDNVANMFEFRDFNFWYLPQKGEVPRNHGAIIIPLLNYAVSLAVVCISFCVICGYTDAFDIVMNSLAFTFIAEVGDLFNKPLARHYAKTAISGLDPNEYGPDPIYYLVTEYSPSQCYDENGLYSEDGWYILEEDRKAGLLTDYRFRHNPDEYEHPSRRIVSYLQVLLYVAPVLSLFVCYWIKAPAVLREEL